MVEEMKTLWGPREEGGLYDPKKSPFDQGSVRRDFADRFCEVDGEKRTVVDFMETEVNALQRLDGSTVVVGHAPGLLKNLNKDGDIDGMGKLLEKQAGGVLYMGSLRSRDWQVSAAPNVAFHDGETDEDGRVQVVDGFSGQEGAVNNFAVHTPEITFDYLGQLGIEKNVLEARGQILIASVLATPFDGAKTRMEDYLKDWQLLIERMAEAGIRYIDLNFANPHVPEQVANACEGTQFRLPEAAREIAKFCRKVVDDIGWGVKLGVNLRHVHRKNDSNELDEEVMGRLVDGIAPYVDFITAVNTDPKELVSGDDESQFATVHPISGVSGRPLHEKALQVVRFLTDRRRTNGYEYKVLATGGAVDARTIQNFVDAEADAVLSMTGLYRDGELFQKYSQSEEFAAV